MSDQATELRRLMAQAAGQPAALAGGPPSVVVAGGRPGVGATTIALQLAVALAQEALRVVLIDADLYRADVAARCALPGPLGIGDVLAGRKSIHEAIQRGPAGMQVLAGTASAEARALLTPRTMQRLFRQLKTLAPHADWLLVDAGNQPSELAARLWTAATRVALVTSPDAVAVMDTYAMVKTLLSRQPLRPTLALIVNQAEDEPAARDVHHRIDQSCRRFLGLSVGFAGHLPADPGRAWRRHSPIAESSEPFDSGIARLSDALFRLDPPAASRTAA